MTPQKLIYLAKLHFPLRPLISRIRQALRALTWDGKGPAPHPVKQQMIRTQASRHGLSILVETGTFYGDMVAAMQGSFQKIYSVELSHDLAEKAKRRFASSPNVSIIEGDSASTLKSLVPSLDAPALFWLDGHYSAGVTAKGADVTPIMDELRSIFASPIRHVVLIDDARCFDSDPGYPRTEVLQAFVTSSNRSMTRTTADSFLIE